MTHETLQTIGLVCTLLTVIVNSITIVVLVRRRR